jgi:hypothetical protein
MSATATEFGKTAQEQTLKSVKQSQDVVVEAVRTWASAVEKALPETPAIPFADKLPTPQAIVKATFDFAEELLKAQREFIENLLDAATPLIAPKTPSKKA